MQSQGKLLLILLFGILVFGFSCHRNRKFLEAIDSESRILTLDLDPDHFVNKEYHLSETCDSIEYVFLETNPSNFIGSISTIQVTPKYIVLTDKITRKVHAFNRDGSYLFEISKSGKGPGEYIQVDDLVIDESNNWVYLSAGSRKLLKYSLDNRYLSTVKLDIHPRYISIFDEGYVSIVISPKTFKSSGYSFNFQDFNGKILYQVLQHNLSLFNGKEPAGFSTKYSVNNTVCLWEGYMDTIYGFTNKGQVLPRWSLKYPNNHISQQEAKSAETLNQAIRNGGFQIIRLFETPSEVFIEAVNRLELISLIINKGKQEYVKTSTNCQIENDIDGIINYWPRYSVANNTTLMAVEPIDFKKSFNQSVKNSRNTTLLGDLKEKVSKIGQFDNPILCIVTHK